jgi:putative ATP-dependent endonuclease of the OLD family
MASITIKEQTVSLRNSYAITENDDFKLIIAVNTNSVQDQAAKEIVKKIKDSNIMFLYNSTTSHEEMYFDRYRSRMYYDFVMSADEKKALNTAQKQIEKKMRQLARDHTRGLSDVLGRLSEKYDVEASPPEGFAMRRMPIGINLKDRNVEVRLNDWGSGTQNRTHILMAVLQANRIKTTCIPDEKITPFVVIEEPESFLHPSAQAEFGSMLKTLSNEFAIQIIATTHSPYMLNQEEPQSNILLSRHLRRQKICETELVEVGGDNWMAPFADHLGIGVDEFKALRPIFSSGKSKVLLVEGSIDVSYFEFLQQNSLACEKLSADIEVVAYGGKDTLKNTVLVQFVLIKFDKVFVTYDLDSNSESGAALARLQLKENIDYAAVGINQAGKDCIEGLLPEMVLSVVNGRETDLVMKLGSGERKKAKATPKNKYLEEFKKRTDYTKDELKDINKIIKLINSRLKV